MIDLDVPVMKDGRTIREVYGKGYKFIRCEKCNQECTGTWNGLCVECMPK